jgi:hypothetical protein
MRLQFEADLKFYKGVLLEDGLISICLHVQVSLPELAAATNFNYQMPED